MLSAGRNLVNLSMEDFDAKEDIAHYLRTQLATIGRRHKQLPSPWPSHPELQVLITDVAKRFVVAATIVRFLASKNVLELSSSISALVGRLQTHNPSNIDELYRYVISGSTYPPRACLCILAIVLAARPLAIEELDALLPFDVPPVLDSISAIVHVPRQDPSEPPSLGTYHTSLRDFLLDRRRSNSSYVDPVIVHQFLAYGCLQIMRATLKDDMLELGDPATLHTERVDFSERRDRMLSPALRHPRPEIRVELLRFATQNLLQWIETSSLLGLLNHALRSLISVKEKYSVYHNALAMSPLKSSIRGAYAHHLDYAMICEVKGLDEEWDFVVRTIKLQDRSWVRVSQDGRWGAAVEQVPDAVEAYSYLCTGLEIWNLVSGVMTTSRGLPNIPQVYFKACFTADGSSLVYVDGPRAVLWSLLDDICVFLQGPSPPTCLSISPSGHAIATVHRLSLAIWQPTPRGLGVQWVPFTKPWSSFPPASLEFSHSGSYIMGINPGYLAVWDTITGSIVRSCNLDPLVHATNWFSSFSSDDTFIIHNQRPDGVTGTLFDDSYGDTTLFYPPEQLQILDLVPDSMVPLNGVIYTDLGQELCYTANPGVMASHLISSIVREDSSRLLPNSLRRFKDALEIIDFPMRQLQAQSRAPPAGIPVPSRLECGTSTTSIVIDSRLHVANSDGSEFVIDSPGRLFRNVIFSSDNNWCACYLIDSVPVGHVSPKQSHIRIFKFPNLQLTIINIPASTDDFLNHFFSSTSSYYALVTKASVKLWDIDAVSLVGELQASKYGESVACMSRDESKLAYAGSHYPNIGIYTLRRSSQGLRENYTIPVTDHPVVVDAHESKLLGIAFVGSDRLRFLVQCRFDFQPRRELLLCEWAEDDPVIRDIASYRGDFNLQLEQASPALDRVFGHIRETHSSQVKPRLIVLQQSGGATADFEERFVSAVCSEGPHDAVYDTITWTSWCIQPNGWLCNGLNRLCWIPYRYRKGLNTKIQEFGNGVIIHSERTLVIKFRNALR
ncbi:hypothetical protein CONPUDRAFT_72140 [Coniophora puteana RWD-64-598 SS2]|uniref:WD40 repeat-like protein n=1 Tax=Coniophora puteana (strain RWD-64-598) TaxID=741705 RepID=A0A5M3MSW2_CONPW|nr:uncharacterized protein CONPUDRAFT_72140 [Coniophora puteana RWD-64-598 SS2]EIW81735.1 hypothetical protein CONPUDRAFT_72140 [Coniophora puteana RWD-64-598 SS2]